MGKSKQRLSVPLEPLQIASYQHFSQKKNEFIIQSRDNKKYIRIIQSLLSRFMNHWMKKEY